MGGATEGALFVMAVASRRRPNPNPGSHRDSGGRPRPATGAWCIDCGDTVFGAGNRSGLPTPSAICRQTRLDAVHHDAWALNASGCSGFRC